MEELKAGYPANLKERHKMAHKTLEQWHKSNLDLNRFLQVGDTVDEAMWEYFLGVLPPAYCSGSLLQIGEPYDHVQGKATFPTLHMENGLWTWKGNCYRAAFLEPYPRAIRFTA